MLPTVTVLMKNTVVTVDPAKAKRRQNLKNSVALEAV